MESDGLCPLHGMIQDTNVKKWDDIAVTLKAYELRRDKDLDLLYNAVNSKVSQKLFFWLMGFVFAILLGIGGSQWDNNKAMTRIETQQVYVIKALDKIEKAIEK